MKINEKNSNNNYIPFNNTNTITQPSFNLKKNNNNKNNAKIFPGVLNKSLTSNKTSKTKNSTENDFSEYFFYKIILFLLSNFFIYKKL